MQGHNDIHLPLIRRRRRRRRPPEPAQLRRPRAARVRILLLLPSPTAADPGQTSKQAGAEAPSGGPAGPGGAGRAAGSAAMRGQKGNTKLICTNSSAEDLRSGPARAVRHVVRHGTARHGTAQVFDSLKAGPTSAHGSIYDLRLYSSMRLGSACSQLRLLRARAEAALRSQLLW